MGGVFLALASLFSVKKHQIIHDLFVVISCLLVGLGVVLVSLFLLQISDFYGYSLISLTIIVILTLIFSSKFEGGTWEIPLFLAVFLWNIIASVFLLTN